MCLTRLAGCSALCALCGDVPVLFSSQFYQLQQAASCWAGAWLDSFNAAISLVIYYGS